MKNDVEHKSAYAKFLNDGALTPPTYKEHEHLFRAGYLAAQDETQQLRSKLAATKEEAVRLRVRVKELEDAIDAEMVSSHIGVFGSGDDPKKAIMSLLCFSQGVGAFFERAKAEYLVECAQAVVDRWEKGDLAGAIRILASEIEHYESGKEAVSD